MLSIRLARPADAPVLAALLGELFAQEREFAPDPAAQLRGLSLIFDQGSEVRIVVAEVGGRVIGMGALHYLVSTYLGAKVAMLEDVIVTASQRGNGIGKALMAALIEQARADGCERITLLTDHDNATGQGFYESFGFSRSTMLPYRLMLKRSLTA